MKKYLLLISVLLISILPAYSKHLHYEKEYQNAWCKNYCGQIEYILDDGTRVDCLTNTHAIEFDFANKWAESIGQALYYGIKTSKKPGIVLIIENPQKDIRYIKRLKTVAGFLCIDYWLMYERDLYCK